jgi:membrane-associated protein
VNEVFEQLSAYFAHYGYWTLAVALLLENAGVPVPGETILITASVLARTGQSLSLPVIVVVATLAATLGDNLGFALGHWGGRRLLDRYRAFFRIRPEAIARGERIFRRYGPVTVFAARFIVGLRVFAGPLAGVLRMHWARFAAFNALGALTWVTVIASVGYAFGRQVPALLRTMRTANLALLAIVVLLAVIFGKRLLARFAADNE